MWESSFCIPIWKQFTSINQANLLELFFFLCLSKDLKHLGRFIFKSQTEDRTKPAWVGGKRNYSYFLIKTNHPTKQIKFQCSSNSEVFFSLSLKAQMISMKKVAQWCEIHVRAHHGNSSSCSIYAVSLIKGLISKKCNWLRKSIK